MNSTQKTKKKKYFSYKTPVMEIPKAPKRHMDIDFHINTNTRIESNLPIDYTFKKFKRLGATGPEFASSGRLGRIDRAPNNKYLSRSLWLNNNFITNIHKLEDMVNSVMAYPERLGFLDLSCNEIQQIDDEILKFQNIHILYLHGNQLKTISDIIKLSKLKQLHNLTMYGNPLYKKVEYGNIRAVISQIIPQLKKLDFNGISPMERQAPMSTRATKMYRELTNKYPKYLPIKSKPKQVQKDDKKAEIVENVMDDKEYVCPPLCNCFRCAL